MEKSKKEEVKIMKNDEENNELKEGEFYLNPEDPHYFRNIECLRRGLPELVVEYVKIKEPIEEKKKTFKLKSKEIVVVVDIETTGFDEKCDAIVEIGMCKLHLETGEIEPLFNETVNEKDREINQYAWIFRNSDLSHEKVIESPDIEVFRDEIQDHFNSHLATSFNQRFDFGFLEQRGFEINDKYFDPMLVLRNIMRIPFWNGYKLPSVQESWNFLFPNEKKPELHRALDDAMMEAKIIHEIYRRYYRGK